MARRKYGRKRMRRRRTFRRRKKRTRRKRNQATLPKHAFAKLRLGWHFTWMHGYRDNAAQTFAASHPDTSGAWTPAAISWPTVDVYRPFFITKQTGAANGYTSVFGGLGAGEWLISNLADTTSHGGAYGGSVKFHQRQPRGWDRLMMYYRYYKPTACSMSLRLRPMGKEEILQACLHSGSYYGMSVSATSATAHDVMNDMPLRVLWCTKKFAHRAGESGWTAGTGAHEDSKSRIPFEKPLQDMFWNQLRRQNGVRERRLHPWEDQNHSLKIRWYAKQPHKHFRGASAQTNSPAGGIYESMWNPTDKAWNSKHEDSGPAMWVNEGLENISKRMTPWFHLYVVPEGDVEEITPADPVPPTAESRKIRAHPIALRVDGVQTFYVKLARPYRMMDDRVYTKPVMAMDENEDEVLGAGEDAQQGAA